MAEVGRAGVEQHRIVEISRQIASVFAAGRLKYFAVAVSGKIDEQVGTDGVDVGRVVRGGEVAHDGEVTAQCGRRSAHLAQDTSAQGLRTDDCS